MELMLPPSTDNLCPICNFREYYCDIELFGACDCCSCRTDLCKDNPAESIPLPPLKEVA